MNLRFICPHCHAAINPENLDVAFAAGEDYRVCPDCDELILLPRATIAGAASVREPAVGVSGGAGGSNR